MLGGCRQAEKAKPEPQAAAGAIMRDIPPQALFTGYEVVDLSVIVGERWPAHWGANPPMQRWTYNWFAEQRDGVKVPSDGPYYGQRYVIDEHTGTQTDFPAHFVPPPGSRLEFAGSAGKLTGDRYPLERMMGPAAVIDVTTLVDKAENGKSAVITLAMVQEWEKQHGEIQPGDVVLFYSGYTDRFYRPLPFGQRMTFDVVVTKTKPGWPAPAPEVMGYLYRKGVWHAGTDGPSMGPAEGGQAVHVAGLQYGMSWEEMLINLGKLPARGAFYIALPLKIVEQSGSPTRAMAFVPKRPAPAKHNQ